MTGPLVSFVIPTLGKRPRFLAKALASVRNQGHERVAAVVVVDDRAGLASTEEVVREARVLGFDDLTVIGSYAGRLGAARNAGLAHALEAHPHPDFVGFLDDDDVLKPWHVERLVKALADEPKATAAYSDAVVQHCDAENRPMFPGRRFEGPFTVAELARDNRRPCHAFLYRAERVAAFRFDPDVYGCEDWDWLLQLAQGGAWFVHVPGVSAEYRVRGDGSQMSTGTASAMQEAARKVQKRYAHLVSVG